MQSSTPNEPPAPFTDFIFVDFENVQEVDLALVREKPVHVTVLIGAKQTKLPTGLAVQFGTFASQVRPIEVGGSGRNALDLTLAVYLGRTLERNPNALFTIVSKDHDFDAMVEHLRQQKVGIARVGRFADAPCFNTKKPKAARKPTAPSSPPKPLARPTKAERNLAALCARLADPANKNRPRNKRALEAHIRSSLGGDPSLAEVAHVLQTLVQAGTIIVAADGKVSYGSSAGDAATGT